MFGRVLKPRALASFFSQQNRSYCSPASSLPRNEFAVGSAASMDKRLPRIGSLFKFALFSTVSGAAAGSAYATYAYTLEDVENKTKGLREFTPYIVKDDASTLEKLRAFLYSAIKTVPAKSIEHYLNLRRLIEDKVWDSALFLPDLHPNENGARVYTLVLDLDETLVYTDYNHERGWKTFKRPGVDAFLQRVSQIYEVVIYTDQPSEYADPIVKRLNDTHLSVRYALSRKSTRYQNGKRYRDLSKLNRDPRRVIYVSGHPQDSTLQPENGIPVKAWKLEADDKSLTQLLPFLEYVGSHRPEDIRPTLQTYKDLDIPSEFERRSKGQTGSLWRR